MSQDQRSTQFEGKQLEPSDFKAPGEPSIVKASNKHQREGIIATAAGAWWQSQFNLMLLVFGLLGVIAVTLILLAPESSSSVANVRVSVAGGVSKAEPVSGAKEDADEVSPFSKAQLDQARADSQDILADLLDVQKSLQDKQVEDWAAQDYEAALKMAEFGDEFYSQKNYIKAINEYRDSYEMLKGIEQKIPQEVTRRVSLGLEAVDEGKSELANQYFQSALRLDVNSISALEGLERVKTLDQVLQYLAIAADFEKKFVNQDDISDLAEAKVNMQAAVDLDASTQSARLGLERLENLQQDKLYRDAMSLAYRGLFAGKYSSARSYFNTALNHKPDDQTATAGLRQALASDKRVSLSALLTAANQFESREQWASALSNYQTVLQRDRNQVSAKIGQIRTQARLDLDRKIKEVLSDPLLLAKETKKAQAQEILAQATAIKTKGSTLKAQIVLLKEALNDIEVTIKVALLSDQSTEVSLKREGSKRLSLGRFNSKRMALKPGRYVLTGTRLGFRDVRKEIVLSADSKDSIQQFSIVCKQALIAAESGGIK